MATVDSAAIKFTKPGDDTAYLTLDGTEVDEQFSIKRRVAGWKDVGQVAVFNASGFATDITRGDKVEITANLRKGSGKGSATTSPGAVGRGSLGQMSLGGGKTGGDSIYLKRRWVGLAHPPTLETTGARNVALDLDLSDFVFQVMSDRRVYNAFEDMQVATGDDDNKGIVDTLLANNAPEIDRSQIHAVTDTATYEFDGTNLLEAVQDLAAEADALIASMGDALMFQPMDNLPHQFALETRDFGTLKRTGSDTDLVNELRVDGSMGTQVDEEIPESNQSSLTTVTDSSRITYQLDPTKSRIDRVTLYTSTISTSDDGIRVRLQQTNSGDTAPVDATDTSKDITNASLEPSDEDWVDGGLTPFKLPREPLSPTPWLIIEATGSSGQDVGVDSNGDPVFQSWYPFPIAVKLDDPDSQDEYRLVEDRKKRDDIAQFKIARRFGEGILARDGVPATTVTFDAYSDRATDLDPGNVLTLDYPIVGAVGDYVVTEVAETYSADMVQVQTTITAEDIDTL